MPCIRPKVKYSFLYALCVEVVCVCVRACVCGCVCMRVYVCGCMHVGVCLCAVIYWLIAAVFIVAALR